MARILRARYAENESSRGTYIVTNDLTFGSRFDSSTSVSIEVGLA